ncbi:MAG TPA: peptidylprolyl isomerase [Rhodospirillales bacterium]|nr:peptidylprolyl isomerase [Rhodospirillales bacterium]
MTVRSAVSPSRVLAAPLLGLLLLVAVSSPAPAAVEVGAAVEVVRNVYGNTLNRRMRDGDRLIADQKVRTGVESAVNILFMDGSTLFMGGRSELRLESFVYQSDRSTVEGAFDMVRGVLRFVSSKVRLDVTIRTSQAQIGIRGTKFDVYTTPSLTEIAVLEGTVRVDSAVATDFVSAGQVYRIEQAEGTAFAEGVSAEMGQAVSAMLALVAADGEGGDGRRETRRAGAQQALAAAESGPARAVPTPDPENLLYLDLASGRMIIEMLPDLAPRHVARIKELVRARFYDGLAFHHVVPGYVAETGDPTGTGKDGSGTALEAEFSDQLFVRGAIGMTRKRDDQDSANSLFFITLGRAPRLDGRYTVWGRVIHGIEITDRLAPGSPPKEPDRILSLRAAGDVVEMK